MPSERSIFQFHFTIREGNKDVKFTSKLTLAALKEIPIFNMVVPLIEITKEQQRYVIRFLWSEGVETDELYGRMATQYGDSYMNQRKVHGLLERLKGRLAIVSIMCVRLL
jgi:hypothetical protein